MASLIDLNRKIAKLQNQIDTLQTRIRQLERNRPARTAVTVRDNTRHSSEKPSAAPADSPLESARKQYRSGNFAAAAKLLIAGDVLFYESIGRTDFPRGNHQDLLDNIRHKLFRLPNDTLVIPGHARTTTIGHEKQFNPYVGGAA